MAGYCRYKRLKKQVSYDSGATWQDVSPAEYMKGDLIEADSTICGYAVYTRWVESGYTCVGYDKHAVEYEQTSNDNINWTYTQRSRTGRLIEANSEDCGYEPPTPPTPTDYSTQYLTFRALEDGTFSFTNSGMSYSLDSGSTWNTLTASANTPTVQSGQTIMWKATLTASDNNGIGRFISSGLFEAEGNAMSLKYGDNFIGQTTLTDDYSFCSLFSNYDDVVLWFSKLANAENLVLPATSLTTGCYAQMFIDCYDLTKAPVLPATTLADLCYFCMFQSCKSLTTAPVLPAATLSWYSYFQMFYYCTNLNSITCLATDISATNSTQYWTENVASSGTFYKNPSMNNWTTGDSGIPSGWIVVNNS